MSTKNQSVFYAWINRMSLVTRWPRMKTHQTENVSEHSHQTAVIAHLITTIDNHKFGGTLDPHKAATYAIYHELSESVTGDIAAPVKYANAETTKMFKNFEHQTELDCVGTIPDYLQESMRGFVVQREVPEEYRKILKGADKIAAYIKTLNEIGMHNPEFNDVKVKLESQLKPMIQEIPAMREFVNVFVPHCTATLDKLVEAQPKSQGISDINLDSEHEYDFTPGR